VSLQSKAKPSQVKASAFARQGKTSSFAKRGKTSSFAKRRKASAFAKLGKARIGEARRGEAKEGKARYYCANRLNAYVTKETHTVNLHCWPRVTLLPPKSCSSRSASI
jgi:hypothetical protein